MGWAHPPVGSGWVGSLDKTVPNNYILITLIRTVCRTVILVIYQGWLGSRVVNVLDAGAEGPGIKSQSRRCRVTVLGKLFTPTVPLFTKQQNW